MMCVTCCVMICVYVLWYVIVCSVCHGLCYCVCSLVCHSVCHMLCHNLCYLCMLCTIQLLDMSLLHILEGIVFLCLWFYQESFAGEKFGKSFVHQTKLLLIIITFWAGFVHLTNFWLY